MLETLRIKQRIFLKIVLPEKIATQDQSFYAIIYAEKSHINMIHEPAIEPIHMRTILNF